MRRIQALVVGAAESPCPHVDLLNVLGIFLQLYLQAAIRCLLQHQLATVVAQGTDAKGHWEFIVVRKHKVSCAVAYTAVARWLGQDVGLYNGLIIGVCNFSPKEGAGGLTGQVAGSADEEHQSGNQENAVAFHHIHLRSGECKNRIFYGINWFTAILL